MIEPLQAFLAAAILDADDAFEPHRLQRIFAALPYMDERCRQEIQDFIRRAPEERCYLPVLEAVRHRRYGLVARQLLAERACRREFLRRLWPSMLWRLRILRYPGTTGR